MIEMFKRDYFTDELLESLEGTLLRPKDDKALKDDIEAYLKSLPLTETSRDVLDALLVDFLGPDIGGFVPYSNPRLWMGKLMVNLTTVMHYFKHASNIEYRKEESDLMYKAFLGIVEIIISHNVNPTRIIGDRGFTVL